MAFLASAFAAMPAPMLVTDARASDNPILWVNDAFVRLTGYAPEEVSGRNCRMFQGPDTDPAAIARMRSAVEAGEPIALELLNYRKDGTAFWNAMTVTPIRDDQGVAYFLASQADVSAARKPATEGGIDPEELERQITARTVDLRAALDRKSALLQAVDHRVKNHLQVISSLMLLKARRTPQGETRAALEIMAERIGALSIVHRLLQSDIESAQFDLRDLVEELLSDMKAGLPDERVLVESDVATMALPAATATPLALMIHELIANAVRHAFPGDRTGRVGVIIRRSESGLRVEISDDGIGMEADANGFGHSLVEMVGRQLRGSIHRAGGDPGTRIAIDVPLPAPAARRE